MKLSPRIAFFATLALAFSTLLVVAGCTAAAEKSEAAALTKVAAGATAVAHATGTTQPVVKLVETIAPQTAPMFSLATAIATGVATLATAAAAGLAAKANASANTAATATSTAATATSVASVAQGAVVEIANDIALFKQANVPFTTATEQLLKDLGLDAIAAVQK